MVAVLDLMGCKLFNTVLISSQAADHLSQPHISLQVLYVGIFGPLGGFSLLLLWFHCCVDSSSCLKGSDRVHFDLWIIDEKRRGQHLLQKVQSGLLEDFCVTAVIDCALCPVTTWEHKNFKMAGWPEGRWNKMWHKPLTDVGLGLRQYLSFFTFSAIVFETLQKDPAPSIVSFVNGLTI